MECFKVEKALFSEQILTKGILKFMDQVLHLACQSWMPVKTARYSLMKQTVSTWLHFPTTSSILLSNFNFIRVEMLFISADGRTNESSSIGATGMPLQTTLRQVFSSS